MNVKIKVKCMKCDHESDIIKDIELLSDFRQYYYTCSSCSNSYRNKIEVIEIEVL